MTAAVLDVRTEILEREAMPTGWEARRWQHSCAGTAPRRLAALGMEPRWHVRYATAWRDDELVGVLPLCRPRVAAMWDPSYDATTLLHRPAPADARRWLFLGGSRDVAAGTLVTTGAGTGEEEHRSDDTVRTSLVAAGVAVGRREGLYVLAAHVWEQERAAFLAAAPGRAAAVPCGETAVLRLPRVSEADPALDTYLSVLEGRRHKYIRREWRNFTAAGLRGAETSVPDAIDEGAAALLATVKRRHGVPDHPRLAALRLRRWHALGLGDYRSFTVHDSAGRLLGASFACAAGAAVEVHEIGLAEGTPLRLHAYLEAGIYAPIRYALAGGRTRIEFGGGGAMEAKRRRGARVETVWAVGFDA